jgi:hypothetical protein
MLCSNDVCDSQPFFQFRKVGVMVTTMGLVKATLEKQNKTKQKNISKTFFYMLNEKASIIFYKGCPMAPLGNCWEVLCGYTYLFLSGMGWVQALIEHCNMAPSFSMKKQM